MSYKKDSQQAKRNWTAPSKLDRKNLTLRVFCYKINYEDKVQIYELGKQGQSFKQIWCGCFCSIKYMVKLIER